MKKMSNKTKRSLAYVGIIGGLGILALTLFGVSQYEKAKYKGSTLWLGVAQTNLAKILKADENAITNENSKYHASAIYYDELNTYFTNETKKNSNAYVGTAIPAYTLSMATLVAFGLVLKHAEKTKEKEEKEV